MPLTQQRINIDLEEAYEIIEKSNLVIFKWTLSEDIPTDFVSDSISIFGYEPEDFYTGEFKDYWAFVHENDRVIAKAKLYDARKRHIGQFKNQYRVICKDGSVRWVEEWVIHERDKDGKLMYEKGILRDITDTVKTSNQLIKSEARYKELFHNAAAAIFIFDAMGNIISCNRFFATLLGLRPDDSWLNLRDFIDDDKWSSEAFFAECAVLDEKSTEIKLRTKSGEDRFLELKARLIQNEYKTLEIQAIGLDITEKKISEERIRYLTEHDTLTGLYNRSYFESKLQVYDEENTQSITIIIGDVNGLKMVNDAFGHKMGDALLVRVAEILTKVFQSESDLIARLSGDEFVMITFDKQVETLIEKIRLYCQMVTDFPFKVDISLGYAVRKRKNMSLGEVFREADHVMYKNKLRTSKFIKSMMIQSLQNRLAEESLETVQHSERIKTYANRVGHQMGLSESSLEELDLTAIMHDIGMISIPKAILNKESTLTHKEYKEVIKHPEIGYHLLIASPSLAGIGDYVLAHHENYDGTGYPQGLKGMEIPLISRIIAVVDAYESMTHDRPYRKARTHDEAVEEILRCSGSKYDPNVVHSFLTIFESDTDLN